MNCFLFFKYSFDTTKHIDNRDGFFYDNIIRLCFVKVWTVWESLNIKRDLLLSNKIQYLNTTNYIFRYNKLNTVYRSSKLILFHVIISTVFPYMF